MGTIAVGDVVLIPFPFSDLKGQKLRPALVVAKAEFRNLVLCQITSKPYASKNTIKLMQSDFVKGGLPVISFVRPDKIFTAETSIIQRNLGTLKLRKKRAVLTELRRLFTA